VTKFSKDTILSANRRTFLKASSLAAISTVIPHDLNATANPTKELPTSSHGNSGMTPVDSVNILQGTDSSFEFSRGNTLPIAALPFGMAHWTLQSHADTPWMFHPGAKRLQGFRCTHQLSPWLDDYGHATFLPFCGEIGIDPASRSSSYRPESSHLTPYSLKTFLLRYRAQVELVPTERCCVLTSTFEENGSEPLRGFLFDIPGNATHVDSDPTHRRILFKSTSNAGGVPINFATYYVVSFPEPWLTLEVKQVGSLQIGVIRFQPGKQLEARIATSYISFEQAALNLEREVGEQSIESLRNHAATRWNEQLGRIEIEGATDDQRRTFYSCLYRTLLFPHTWHEIDAHGEIQHFSAFNGKVMPGVMYADHGYWDVYRAWYPLMSILFPEKLGEILQAWVNAYKEGGWMPQFPAPGYRACMTGSLIDSVFADAAVKGITGFDLSDAFDGLKKHATVPGDPAKGYGRAGLEQYLHYNYIPTEEIHQAVAETVDASYGDFCIAQIAKVLGKEDDCEHFLKRSRNWRNLFDQQSSFLRGKTANGSWETPFDPFTWGSPYVEGSAWQHRWDVPHEIPALFEKFGGKSASVNALELMLTLPARFNVGVYGTEIHEMSEMATVDFGQYAHSNQPVHNVLYLFAHAGRADRTQFWVRKVMRELYTPDAFPGDEDTGSMSAWYVLSALGFYPVCPGKTEYTLGSPLFSKATVRLSGNTKLVIQADRNSSTAVFVRGASLNGQPIAGVVIEHAELMKGGTLQFDMTSSG